MPTIGPAHTRWSEMNCPRSLIMLSIPSSKCREPNYETASRHRGDFWFSETRSIRCMNPSPACASQTLATFLLNGKNHICLSSLLYAEASQTSIKNWWHDCDICSANDLAQTNNANPLSCVAWTCPDRALQIWKFARQVTTSNKEKWFKNRIMSDLIPFNQPFISN